MIRWGTLTYTPYHNGRCADVIDKDGKTHRLIVRRALKGSRTFVGRIDGDQLGEWDNIDMAMSQTAKLARERGFIKEDDDNG